MAGADGRTGTPEYLGKKIESREVKFAMLASVTLPLSALGFAGLAAVTPMALKTRTGGSTGGAQRYGEILYAYASATGNNGSAFAGLGSNAFWDVTMAIAMLLGPLLLRSVLPVLADGWIQSP